MTECKQCEKCVKHINDLKGLRMQIGKLKKKAEGQKTTLDVKPYISKIDVMMNLLENGDVDILRDKFASEMSNFKSMLELVARELSEPKQA